MFTLLRNYRTLFMMCIANNLETSVDAFDTTDDDILDATETKALLESPEAKRIVGLAEVDTLEATVDISSNIDFSDGLSKFEQQTIQYLATKIQKLNGWAIQDGSIDGNIGRGSRIDIAAASGMNISSNADINQTVLDALISKAGDLATVKRAEFALAAQEAVATEVAEAAERQSDLQVVAGFDWENKSDASKDEIKALQTALKALGHSIPTIDGVITPGKSTERAYNATLPMIEEAEFQAAEERVEAADVAVDNIQWLQDAQPIIDEQTEAQENLETLQQSRALHADVYSRLELGTDATAADVKDALKNDTEGKKLLCQLQADMKLLKDEDGNALYTGTVDGHNGVNRAFGSGTARAVTKALEIHGSLTAIRRAARQAEVVVEAANNNSDGRTNTGLDLVAQSEGYESGTLEAFLAKYKVTDSMPETIKNGTSEEQRAWCIDQAIIMWDRENANKSRITFIDGLSQHGNDRLSDVMPELRKNFETESWRAELQAAMIQWLDLTAQDFINGEVGSENYEAFEIAGVIIDSGTLDSAYVAAGNELTRDIDETQQRGTMELPIWMPDGTINPKFAELDFANATYINGALVMTVKNGCEGNLVIIPVQRDKYVPPVVVPRAPRAPRAPWVPRTPWTVTPDLPTFSGLDVNCNEETVPGTRVMEYNGYEIYIAARKVFRVKDGVVESRNFGVNEGVAWKNMSASNVRTNIAEIMQNGTIGIWIWRWSNLWETVWSTDNVCRPPSTGWGWSDKSNDISTAPGVEGGWDEGGWGQWGGNDGGRT